MTDPDLTTEYLGLTLRNPIVSSASTVNANVDHLLALETAGIGAVVLPSLFEEQIRPKLPQPNLDGYNTGPSDYLELIRSAVAELNVPVIASLNGVSLSGWTSYASIIEDAGADAIELNIYLIAADPEVSSQAIEGRYLRLVEEVRAAVDIPIAVKLGPYFTSPANMGRQLVEAGADGLVLFNRFHQPEVDLETLTVTSDLTLSTKAEMQLVLRWMALLRGRIDASLAATSGVRQADDVVKLILVGADVVMLTSALLRHGADYTATVLDGVRRWFAVNGYSSLAEARGSLSHQGSADPGAFERANYAQGIASYVPHRHAW